MFLRGQFPGEILRQQGGILPILRTNGLDH